MKVQIRWFIRRDMPEVLEIERSCFEYVWTEEDFLCCIRQRNCIGMVAEHDHKIVGFMIYELHKRKLRIINFAVNPDYQRQGIGTTMIRCLKEKLPHQRRLGIFLMVRERNTDAQFFFHSQGFIAIEVLNNWYEDSEEDAYQFLYEVPLDDLMPANEDVFVEDLEK